MTVSILLKDLTPLQYANEGFVHVWNNDYDLIKIEEVCNHNEELNLWSAAKVLTHKPVTFLFHTRFGPFVSNALDYVH